MRAARYHEFGGSDVLTVEDAPKPEPGPGEALVEVRAAGVNPIDAKLREGVVSPAPDLPHVAGVDLAGVVRAAGAGVDLSPGDRVFGTGFGWQDPGTFAEYAAVPADRLATIPESVSFVDAGASAMVLSTAFRSLVTRGDLAAADACLVHGGAGGVGHVAVQLAASAGATVVATGREADAEAIRGFGADAVVDYRADDVGEAVRDAVGPVDVVLETHLGANLEADLTAIGRGGRVVAIGQGEPVTLDPGTALGAMFDDADLRFASTMASTDDHRRVLDRCARLLADGSVSPAIAATYPLDEAAAAMDHAVRSGVTGKVVIDVTA
ncbi:MAG: NADPH:quinone reductase [Haloferacaceae archaeon]